MPDGPRFNSSMTNEGRRKYENLMLLCGTHHTEVDRESSTWTVGALRQRKTEHEAIYVGVIDKLIRGIGDVTQGTVFTPAVNLGRLELGDLDAEELEACLGDVHLLATKLASLPLGTRGLLATIVERGDVDSSRAYGWPEMRISSSLLEEVVNVDLDELLKHFEILRDAGFCEIDHDAFWGEGTRREFQIGRSTGGVGWSLFADMKRASASAPALPRRVLEDLDFSALDL